jgi:hypothetical protein
MLEQADPLETVSALHIILTAPHNITVQSLFKAGRVRCNDVGVRC